MAYDIKECSIDVVRVLCERHHGYKSAGNVAAYSFAVYEDNRPVAAFAWQPPPPGASKGVCPTQPSGVLALSRMVAVNKTERKLKHISKPLMLQMKKLIDRSRWPVLVTYSDEGEGHTGYVYKCSGWKKTERREVPIFVDAEGRRSSRYSNGGTGKRTLFAVGTTFIQRWEHWACTHDEVPTWLERNNWCRRATGGTYRSGNPAFRWVRAEEVL